jgi:hypothetical protein
MGVVRVGKQWLAVVTGSEHVSILTRAGQGSSGFLAKEYGPALDVDYD